MEYTSNFPIEQFDLSNELGPDFASVFTDGLPLARVSERELDCLLEEHGAGADICVATLPPTYQEATYRRIAAFCLLSGGNSKIFPALVATISAIAETDFNLLGVQTTTSAVGVATVLSGPNLQGAGFYGGAGASGPGCRANVTLARANRLIMMNVGGAVPGLLDPASIGWPGKLGFTIVEHADASPWGPLHTESERDLLAAFPVNGFIELTDSQSGSAAELLEGFSRMLCFTPETAASDEALLLLTPHHAGLLSQGGYTRSDFSEAVTAMMNLSDARSVTTVVTGGTGGKSASLPLWGESRSVKILFNGHNFGNQACKERT